MEEEKRYYRGVPRLSWKREEKDMGGYDRFPSIRVRGSQGQVFQGEAAIRERLKRSHSGGEWVCLAETYPGVSEDRVRDLFSFLEPDLILRAKDVLRREEDLRILLSGILTKDRVFGRMYAGDLTDFLDPEKLEAARERVRKARGRVLVYGFGASLFSDHGLLVFADISRWEIQLRYRAGMSSYLTHNPEEDILKKFKQGYFLEWRIGDKVKRTCLDRMDLYLDMNRDEAPVMIEKALFDRALEETAGRPFRCVPYFDPGVWGGQWMKKVCGLDMEAPNYAWSFDGVPEENSLLFDFEGTLLEMPAMNLVLTHPEDLLGPQVYARFGAEFPIRFDLLDTMEGQNLSLQVHPTADYIRREFGMAYTQDESYYILEAGEGACVYLGMQEEADFDAMIRDLKRAGETGVFDAEAYINKIPAKKHDHFLIPAGTIHCSGRNTVVLEISATPYIFTFKLWDWGRLGLDGKPRPIHIDRGEQVIRRERRTSYVMEHLVNRTFEVKKDQACTEEHTGLHELEFIETRRFTIREEITVSGHGSVSVLNLVEGKEVLAESEDGRFAPFRVHYAETFIVPARAGTFRLRAVHGPVRVLQAYVRPWA